MADMLRDAIGWLSGMLNEHAASPVIYRSESGTFSCKATYARTETTIADEYGSTLSSFEFDFLIRAEDLNIVPQIGDIIEADGHEFRVTSLAGETWRWSDPHMIIRRIHTRRTDGAKT